MKRLCLIRHGYYPRDARVRKEIKALRESGWTVEVVCLRIGQEAAFEQLDGVTVHRLPLRHRRTSRYRYLAEYLAFLLWALAKVTQLHLRRKFDVVQINNMPDVLVFAALVPKLNGTPVVLDMHELMPEMYRSLFNVSARHGMIRLLTRLESLSTRFADRVIAVNEPCRQRLQERGVPPGKLAIILNSPDDGVFRAEEKSATPAAKKGFRLLSHGSLLKRYGYDTLLRTLPGLARTLPDLQLDLIGAGEERPALQRLAGSLGVESRVVFHGMLLPDQVRERILEATLCVVPLIDNVYTHLMLPNKLFEYMALERPVISSDLTAIRHYFHEGEVSFFEPGNVQALERSIQKLAAHPEQRQALVRNATRTYRRYEWAHHKQDYVNLINALQKSPLHSQRLEAVAWPTEPPP